MPTVAIAASTSGAANELVAAVAGKRIKVIAFKLSFSGTVNAKFQSAQTTDLTGLIYGVAAKDADGQPPPPTPSGPRPLFEAARGEALTLNLSGATAVGGYVVYDTGP